MASLKKLPQAKRRDETSLVRRVARDIRTRALECQVGELVGSEDDLVERFKVSRPTFRQAAKIVEQEQLLRIKRGVGGGYFADRPDSAVVSHVTAIYLHTHQTSLAHIVAAVRPLFVSTARLAALNLSPELQEQFEQFAQLERETITDHMSTLDFVKSDKSFTLMFAESSGNPLIQLFIDIVLDLASMTSESVWKGHPDRIREARELRLRLIHAILLRDVELSEISAKRLTEQAAAWTLEINDGQMKVEMPRTEVVRDIANV